MIAGIVTIGAIVLVFYLVAQHDRMCSANKRIARLEAHLGLLGEITYLSGFSRFERATYNALAAIVLVGGLCFASYMAIQLMPVIVPALRLPVLVNIFVIVGISGIIGVVSVIPMTLVLGSIIEGIFNFLRKITGRKTLDAEIEDAEKREP